MWNWDDESFRDVGFRESGRSIPPAGEHSGERHSRDGSGGVSQTEYVAGTPKPRCESQCRIGTRAPVGAGWPCIRKGWIKHINKVAAPGWISVAAGAVRCGMVEAAASAEATAKLA